MKKIFFASVVVVALGLLGLWLFSYLTVDPVIDERVVYLRSIDREGLGYVATVDDVAASLDAELVADNPTTRVFESLSTLPVSHLSVTTLLSGKRLPVFSLSNFLTANPDYADAVFTIEIKNGVITGITEELLEY